MKKSQSQRWWDFPAVLFLLVALISAAIRLQSTRWTEHLGRTEVIVVLAMIFGLALGKSIFHGRTTFMMGLVYTFFFVGWQLTLIMPEMEVHDRVNLLYARLWWSTADFLANKPVKDPILFLATMYTLYWLASLLSSYRLVRYANPWVPLLSLGVMILVIEYTVEMYRYSQVRGALFSFLFLLASLLLMGRIYYLRSKQEWEKRGGTVEMEVGYDLTRGVAVAAVVLALLAWNTPRIVNFFDSDNPANERISSGWAELKDRISKASNALRSQTPMLVEGYGNSLSLGTGGNLGNNLVFTVDPGATRLAGRLYWAGRTYDKYLGAGKWDSTHLESLPMGPSEPAVMYSAWSNRKEVAFTFQSQIPLLRTLYYPAEPLSISREVQAVVNISDDGATDLNAIVMDPPLAAGQDYRILATVAQPSIKAMQEAGEDYPEYIGDRYLQLPANFSPRIKDLAEQIAGEEATPYDKAQAITQYLRRTITYSESVPELPAGRDPLEWFLFDIRSGFCNYYASAEVTMLRSLGVPARLVAGYAEGEWNDEEGIYRVIGKDSHAWPEVYFPGLGWVAFEPTVSQPTVSFPPGDEAGDETASGEVAPPVAPLENLQQMDEGLRRAEEMLNPDDLAALNQRQSLSPWTIALLVVLGITAVLAVLEWRRRRTQDLPLPSWIEKTLDERGWRTPDWLRLWSRRSLRTPIENLFATVAFMLRVWGCKIDPAQTPAEQIATLVNVVPGVRSQAVTLLEEYQRAMYSQYPANLLRASTAVAEIRSIGLRNRLMRLIGFQS